MSHRRRRRSAIVGGGARVTQAAAASRCFGGETATLAHVLAQRLADAGDKPWILAGSNSFSYREVDRLACRLANGLVRLGVGPGDTVLLMLNNCIEFIALWCALAKIGAIEVPVNCHYKGRLLAHIVNDSAARVIIADSEFLARLAEVANEVSALSTVVVYGEAPEVRPGDMLGAARRLPFAEILADDEFFAAVSAAPWDQLAVMYTSGTTGPSKGVIVTHGHAFEYARGVIDMLDIRPDDVYYAPLPLFHIAGQWAVVYAAAIAGATAVLPDSFSPARFWPTCRRYNATCSFLLGAMANLLYRQPPAPDDADNPLERVLIVPLVPEVEDFKQRFGVLVSTTWGGTEMNCPTRSGFQLANARTCGRVDDDLYEVRIVDENDNELPPGVAGEAVVRPKKPWIVMAGYWRHPEWTERAWRNLWLHTGDMLMADADGNLYFVDRTKDAIRRRGENISAMEVEQEINAHPDVLETAVIPVAAELGEQEVMAVIVPKPGRSPVPEALIAFLDDRLPYFMVPRYVEFASELPKTPTGKIQKYALRERGVTTLTWDRVQAAVPVKK
jgi:crotonobetaine/carnitine-CoA ligase